MEKQTSPVAAPLDAPILPDPSIITVPVGGTHQVCLTLCAPATDFSISYASSATNIATVSGAGLTATVTGVAPGTATITVTVTKPGAGGHTETADIAVTVTSGPCLGLSPLSIV